MLFGEDTPDTVKAVPHRYYCSIYLLAIIYQVPGIRYHLCTYFLSPSHIIFFVVIDRVRTHY